MGGRDYLVEPLQLGDLGTIQNHLALKHHDLLGAAGRAAIGLPPDVQKMMIGEAVREHRRTSEVTIDDCLAWATNTLDGLAFTFWLLIEKKYPGALTADRMRALLVAMSLPELQQMSRKLATAGGVDQVGNSTGRSEQDPSSASGPAKTGDGPS